MKRHVISQKPPKNTYVLIAAPFLVPLSVAGKGPVGFMTFLKAVRSLFASTTHLGRIVADFETKCTGPQRNCARKDRSNMNYLNESNNKLLSSRCKNLL